MHFVYASLSVLILGVGLFRLLVVTAPLSESLFLILISAVLAVAAEVSELSAAYQRSNPEAKPEKPSDM